MTDIHTADLTTTGPDRPELHQAVQAFVDAGFAGIQLRVHDERGEWVGSAGVRELGGSDRPSTDGRFWAGSVVKTFTATAVLQLVAEERLALDAPVADHLPELAGLDPRVTVRMLLQHTSGLFNYTGEYFEDGTIVPGIPATGKEWVDNRLRTYEPQELIRLALSKPARFEPGTGFGYSNTNYTLAALLIEAVAGRSYGEEMRRRVLEPLGLRDTVLAGAVTDLPEPHAHGYYRYQDGEEWKVVDVSRQNLTMLLGAGGLISTTRDLHTFFAALNSGTLLPPALLAEMRKPYGELGYGLGLFVQDLGPDAGTVYHHNGGAPGGYGALMYSTPDGSRTLTAGMTTGDADINPAEVFPQALARLVEDVFGASARRAR
ncbi:serine hydrolase domain-containing protein [Streptomyces sp. RerS4]|uniref:serine hydrolase domain-containing protein n=1 Tax=Streptomyces sp. RerS4 TaxID=2942449 RepID=UPI00201BE487|nr:serine hydrolase domain-containing protein [Streptomyces sp. RerS4]UQX02453.1 beta-lactamase family protein [Streptomyces sp. RerS4]